MTILLFSPEPLHFTTLTVLHFKDNEDAWEHAMKEAKTVADQINGEIHLCPNGIRITKGHIRQWTLKVVVIEV